MKRVNTFVAMGSEVQESKEKKVEGSEETAKGSRKKMLGRKRAGKEQQQESSKKQRMEEDKESDEVEEVSEDDEGELMKHLVIKKDEDIAIDAIPLATKLPVIIDYKLHKEGMLVHYQLIRADGSSKRYSSMIRMLQGIDREDLEALWKIIEPTSIAKALSDSSWVEAMQEELLQFKLQQVWILVDLPNRKKAIGTKWVFRNKKDERGIVIRNKARIEAIRLFLAYASFMGFLVYQMDVKSAFLYGTIEEEVYVTQPPGFKDPDHPDKVYKVVKALYGLHQAPRAWYETLANYLLSNGFKRGKIDQTLFIKKQKGDILLVQVYVDDIIFGSTNKELCTGFEKLMKDKFQMSSMGELTFFLGLQVQQKEDGIFISQDKYVAEILKKFNYSDVKSASTPVDLEKPLVKDGDADDVDVHLYRSMIGSLMYLTASRPDIMFAILERQSNFRPLYSMDSPIELVAYTDSDYAGATQDRKSKIGGCQFLGNRLISWQCKKQTVVATSTTKAKYVAAANCYGQVAETHTVVGSRKKPEKSDGFAEIIDFLKASSVSYALAVNPLQALVDKKRVIVTESSIRRDLHLDDAEEEDPEVRKEEKCSRHTRFEKIRKVGLSRSVGPLKTREFGVLLKIGEDFGGDDGMHVEANVDGMIDKQIVRSLMIVLLIKAAKPKVITTAATTTTTTRPKDIGVVIQDRHKLSSEKYQIALDEQIARDIQAKLDAELLEEQKLARKQEEEAK
ncbi:putative ribonuclease H-like domain-containing protein [Tanacetum coccineum]|uniref:Ribonuclease H-like domain-containing protein n=1 Tax=Tanacetum coccineum TaxID=301880 RepID=A0ABQ5J6R9_9ASTR